MGPRIRTLKPEIWISTDMLHLSVLGRLVFVILITQADDLGRLKTNARHVAVAWLGDALLAVDVEAQLVLMERRRMVQRWRVGDDFYLALCNWDAHQAISHPGKSRIPAPPEFKRLRKAPEDSGARARARTGPDRTGPEGTGPDPLLSAGADLALVLEPEVSRGPIEQVFDAWLASTGRSGRTLLDDKRRRLIARALKSYPLEDLLDAVDGWRFDAHHRGENDRARPYNDLELILRDPQHIERFREFKRTPAAILPAAKRSLSTAYREQAAVLRERGD